MFGVYRSYKALKGTNYVDLYKTPLVSQDGKYRMQLIQPQIDYLHINRSVKTLSDFITFFRNDNHYLNKDINKCVKNTIRSYNENNPNNPINWFESRPFDQTDLFEKNILINRIAVDYDENLKDSIKAYNLEHPNLVSNPSEFNQKLQKLIDQVKVQAKKKDFAELILSSLYNQTSGFDIFSERQFDNVEFYPPLKPIF